MATLFVSDIHLSAERPAIVARFIEFLEDEVRSAEALYILGDCFDVWLGDDDDRPPHPEVVRALRRAAARLPIEVMRGNHDFLLGAGFEAQTGCRLIDDPSVIEVHGTRVLLTHGDLLCTDDVEYQRFRAQARDPDNQRSFLAMPLHAREAEAERLRSRSKTHTRLKPEQIMDVNEAAVLEAMRRHRVRHLLHGHTHRPAVHELRVDGERARRIVLGDWYEQDSVLVWGERGFHLGRLSDLSENVA